MSFRRVIESPFRFNRRDGLFLQTPFIVSDTFKSARLNLIDRADENTFAQIEREMRDEKGTTKPNKRDSAAPGAIALGAVFVLLYLAFLIPEGRYDHYSCNGNYRFETGNPAFVHAFKPPVRLLMLVYPNRLSASIAIALR